MPFTANVCRTGVAANQVLSPACVAVILQLPIALNVAVVPETSHTLWVDDVYVTARPEVAVAVSVKGVPTICVPGLEKVIVCGFPVTAKVCVTEVAAAQVVSPDCAAVILQLPVDAKVTIAPDTSHTPVVDEEYVTVRPEVAVAARVNGIPNVCAPGFVNVIV